MKKINGLAINENDIMVSFDMIPLFTNVPVQDTIVIKKQLKKKTNGIDSNTAMFLGTVFKSKCIIYFRWQILWTNRWHDNGFETCSIYSWKKLIK